MFILKAASQTLHLFTPHGDCRRDFRNIQEFIFSITACLVWLTAETWRSNNLALVEVNIKPLHQSQVNKKHMKVMIRYKMLDSVSAVSGFNELDVKNNVRADSLFTFRQRDEIISASYPHRRSGFFFSHTSVTATFCGKKPELGTKAKKRLLYIWMWHHLHSIRIIMSTETVRKRCRKIGFRVPRKPRDEILKKVIDNQNWLTEEKQELVAWLLSSVCLSFLC